MRPEQLAWQSWEHLVLRAFYSREPAAWIASVLGRSRAAVKSRAKILGLHTHRGLRRKCWTPAEDALLRQLYAERANADLARRFRTTLYSLLGRAHILGLKKSPEYTKHCLANCGRQISSHPKAIAARFPKGHAPANKGTRRPGWAPGRMRETQFKKGQPNHNFMPIGATRLVDGYVYRKIADVKYVPYTVNWKPEHVLMWEAVNGPIPPAHALRFRDGDRTHIALDNLELITRRENMRRNSIHNLPPELKQVIQLTGSIRRSLTMHAKRTEKQACRKTA